MSRGLQARQRRPLTFKLPMLCCRHRPVGVYASEVGMSKEVAVSFDELIQLSADDTILFGQTFFPRALRQGSPEFHYELCDKIDDPRYKKLAIKMFRGSGKTTLVKVICAKRISYAISRTIMIISETAEHAVESVKWLKHAVERQDKWARTFGLRRGDEFCMMDTGSERYTWRDDKIQIVCTNFLDENNRPLVITVLGTGIFGQSRGVNVEDYRPDFIILDDVIDEDNAKTPEQRRKVNERIYGAIANTLAPRSEAPTAKLVMVQTPLHREDAVEMARVDPEWDYLEVPCFKPNGTSAWEERFPLAELLASKQGFINRNMLSTWLREMEVRITDDALAYFKPDWLKANFWTDATLPPRESMSIYLGVDPTPPPKDSAQTGANANQSLDDAVIWVIGVCKGHVYLLDTYETKSPIPDEFIYKIIELYRRWRGKKIGFESILFARVLKYYLEQKMMKERCYMRVEPIEDKRKKSDRIRQSLTDLAFEGRLHSHPKFTVFNEQFYSYPDVSHDDSLYALSIALMARDLDDIIEGEWEDVTEDDSSTYLLGCP